MKEFLKGQIHLHTNFSDGLNTPQEVLDAYQSCGYDFIIWTDHRNNFDVNNNFTDKKGVICIGGMELDTLLRRSGEDTYLVKNEFGNLSCPHANALGVYDGNMSFDVVEGNIAQTFANMVDEINSKGGIPMVNHPNWGLGGSYRELLNVHRDYLMEIGNCWDCNISGNFAKESMETIWDILLTQGNKIFATATDDSHTVKSEHINTYFSSYNRGYVGVWAERNEKSILEALRNGDFYASNGIDLEKYEVNEKSMSIKVKAENDEKYAIMFKGRMGIPLKTVYGTEATYEFTNCPDEVYVRGKVISNALKDCPNYCPEDKTYYKGCYTQPYFKNN